MCIRDRGSTFGTRTLHFCVLQRQERPVCTFGGEFTVVHIIDDFSALAELSQRYKVEDNLKGDLENEHLLLHRLLKFRLAS